MLTIISYNQFKECYLIFFSSDFVLFNPYKERCQMYSIMNHFTSFFPSLCQNFRPRSILVETPWLGIVVQRSLMVQMASFLVYHSDNTIKNKTQYIYFITMTEMIQSIHCKTIFVSSITVTVNDWCQISQSYSLEFILPKIFMSLSCLSTVFEQFLCFRIRTIHLFCVCVCVLLH